VLSLVIFDRDGTLIQDTGYPHNPNQLAWMAGSLATLRFLNELGVKTAVATNQSGVARGFFGLEAVDRFHSYMDEQIRSAGGSVAAYAVCPHLPEGTREGYAIECECRKPKPGLVNRLLSELSVAPECAILIGDRERDVVAGQAAGVESFLFDGTDLEMFTRAAIKKSFPNMLNE